MDLVSSDGNVREDPNETVDVKPLNSNESFFLR